VLLHAVGTAWCMLPCSRSCQTAGCAAGLHTATCSIVLHCYYALLLTLGALHCTAVHRSCRTAGYAPGTVAWTGSQGSWACVEWDTRCWCRQWHHISQRSHPCRWGFCLSYICKHFECPVLLKQCLQLSLQRSHPCRWALGGFTTVAGHFVL
jgi:hypothetical protein